jgi:threonine dehydratase
MTPTFADIEAAAGRIAGRVLRTPAVRSDGLSRATGAAEIVLKLDNLQATGAFKERGAANRLSSPCQPATTPRRWRGMPICWAFRPPS